MNPEPILEELVKFVEQKLPGMAISGATDVRRDLPFDSLDQMELLVMIERRYGVTVTPEHYVDQELQVLDHLAAFIANGRMSHTA